MGVYLSFHTGFHFSDITGAVLMTVTPFMPVPKSRVLCSQFTSTNGLNSRDLPSSIWMWLLIQVFHAKAGLDIAISGAFNTGTVAFTVFIRFYTHPDNLCLRLNIPFIQTIFVAGKFTRFPGITGSRDAVRPFDFQDSPCKVFTFHMVIKPAVLRPSVQISPVMRLIIGIPGAYRTVL